MVNSVDMDPWNNTASTSQGEWKTYPNTDAIKMDDITSGEKAKGDEKKDLKTRVQEFGDSTTLHGARYLTNPTYHGARRLFWMVIVLSLFGYLIYNVYGSFSRFIQRPIHTVISVEYADTITFPAVTLCNYNQFRRSTLSEDRLQFFKILNSAEFASPNEVNWTLIANFQANNGLFREDEIRNISHQLSDMLFECTWRNIPCGPHNFTQIITDWGVCYTFNGNIEDALSVSQPGSKHGLSLKMNIEQFEYVFGEASAAGLKVLLHPQGVYPLLKQLGFSVSPGFETSASMHYIEFTNLPYPYPSLCKETKEGTTYSRIYTIHNCHYECQINYVIKHCGCRDYRYPGNATYCGLRELFDCVSKKEEEFISKNLASTECACPIPCNTDQYEGKISMAYLPGQHISGELTTRFNNTENYLRKNIIALNIFFESMIKNTVVEVEEYPFETMLSDVGGSMGLLAGMSLVTVAEFIDFFIVTCCKKYNKFTKGHH